MVRCHQFYVAAQPIRPRRNTGNLLNCSLSPQVISRSWHESQNPSGLKIHWGTAQPFDRDSPSRSGKIVPISCKKSESWADFLVVLREVNATPVGILQKNSTTLSRRTGKDGQRLLWPFAVCLLLQFSVNRCFLQRPQSVPTFRLLFQTACH